MSDWLLLTREVHAAGGALAPARLREFHVGALTRARARGLLEPGAPGRQDPARITPLGKLAATGRVAFRVEPGASTGHGRIKGKGLRPTATWLRALPWPNEVRLTQVVHRAQDDGTCYW